MKVTYVLVYHPPPYDIYAFVAQKHRIPVIQMLAAGQPRSKTTVHHWSLLSSESQHLLGWRADAGVIPGLAGTF